MTELAADLMPAGAFPEGGVLGVLERGRHRVVRTVNEVRARLTTATSSKPSVRIQLGAPSSRVVLEVSHLTYGADHQPFEAVVSVRPATEIGVTFETDGRIPKHGRA